ncbi:MAG: hypothetical protein JW827_10515 [Spirochaetes bacterium]|nr:hypothetical protein [Spirochaetota bacterium]
MKIIKIILFIPAVFSLLVCFWAVIFASYYMAILCLLLAFVLFLLPEEGRTFLKLISVLSLVVLLMFTYSIPVKEINRNIKRLAEIPRNKNTLNKFSFKDKIGIYGLNILMGAAGCFFYPEVSKETLLLMFPHGKDKKRVFRSDFALRSKKVTGELKRFIESLESARPEKMTYGPKKILWNPEAYQAFNDEARVALALNMVRLKAFAVKQEKKYKIKVELKVKCAYPRSSYVTLIKEPELKIEEGLFWVLQEAGWLFPYTAIWQFEVYSDDERIN